MAELNLEQIQQRINAFRNANKERLRGLSPEAIVSIMVSEGRISPSAGQMISIYLQKEQMAHSPQGRNATSIFGNSNTFDNTTYTSPASHLAHQFYDIADEHSGSDSLKLMLGFIEDRITPENVISFLDAYENDDYKQGDSSVVDTITSEIAIGNRDLQKKVLNTLFTKLCEAAKNAGVGEKNIQNAKKDFDESIQKEYDSWGSAFRRVNPLQMETVINYLKGEIISKQNQGTGQIDDKTAIKQFNNSLKETNSTAQTEYSTAREKEGWAASVGDTVCGWFGCKTMEEMEKKLGEHAESVKKLATAKDETEFKKFYKEIFGIEFDKNKIEAINVAQDKYQQAKNLNQTQNVIEDLLKKGKNLNYNELREEIKKGLNFDDKTIDTIIATYEKNLGGDGNSESNKKAMLLYFLEGTASSAKESIKELANGKDLPQMEKDVELLKKSAFGTNDIVSEITQFNENLATTELATEAAAEIAGTVALQFIPGAGQVAAARLAASAAKWGSNGLKIANAAKKAEKGFKIAKTIQDGVPASGKVGKIASKGLQVGTSSANAATATILVGVTDRNEAEAIVKKAFMNMAFAGLGTTSNALAPKLMKTFGIANKQLATEIAEEIINVAGSYGITKLSGADYSKNDAFIDFATGIILSRLAHIPQKKVNTDNKINPKNQSGDGTTKTSDKELNNNQIENFSKDIQEIRDKFAEDYPNVAQEDVEKAIQLIFSVPNADAYDIRNALDNLNDKNIKYIESLLQHEKGKDLSCLNAFLDSVDDDNHKIAEILLKNEKIKHPEIISDILIFSSPGIEDALEQLLSHSKIDDNTIRAFAAQLDATGLKNAYSLLDRNLDKSQIITLAKKSPEELNRTLALLDKGYDFNFAVKAGESNMNLTELNTISDTLGQISDKQKKLDIVVANFVRKNPNINLTELNNYIKSIDMNKLYTIAPNMKNFSQDQLFRFFAYHFKNGTKEFNAESLTLPQDLTAYLQENYVNANMMEEILSVFPLTSRNIGTMPNGWLNGIKPNKHKETIENIYTAISSFQTSRDVTQLSSELRSILNKPVTVEYIAEGNNGIAYKVSVDGSQPVCLKLFKEQKNISQDTSNFTKKYIEGRLNSQGALIEPQVGLFVTANASEQYARMYFGRVCDANTQNTGFCVSEFLEGEVGTNDAYFDTSKNGYRIRALDAHAGNHINGKVIDYGGVLVTDAQGKNLTISDD